MSFCRVGTGLSDDELNTLVAKLKPYFRFFLRKTADQFTIYNILLIVRGPTSRP